MSFAPKAFRVILVIIGTTASLGCAKLKDIASNPSLLGLYDTWTGVCTAGSETFSGATSYLPSLTLNADSTFAYDVAWYASSSSCSNANRVAIFHVTGTFSLTGSVPGGQGISFVVASSDVMPLTTQIQSGMNANCGMTSPFATSGAVNSNNGAHFNLGSVLCSNYASMPATSPTIENVLNLSAGVLMIGSPEEMFPGTPGAAPSSATVPLY